MLRLLKLSSAFVGVIAFIAYLEYTKNDDLVYRQWSKPWPVIATIVYTAHNALVDPTSFNLSILMALVFCLAGDIFLEMRDMFLPGLIAFFIGHIFYIVAFAIVGVLRRKFLYLPFFAYGFAFWWYLVDHLNELKAPVLLYAGILGLMTAGSFATYEPVRRIHGSQIATLIPLGAILFVISDSVLAIHKFMDSSNKNLRYINIITYWGAQVLLAWGSLYVSSSLNPARSGLRKAAEKTQRSTTSAWSNLTNMR